MTFIFNYSFTTLNQYINKERGNRYAAAKIKKTETEFVHYSAISQNKERKTIDYPVIVKFTWNEKNKRTDPDNIDFAKKFILDGLVKANVIIDDTAKYIYGFTNHFTYGNKERSVKVELVEVRK